MRITGVGKLFRTFRDCLRVTEKIRARDVDRSLVD